MIFPLTLFFLSWISFFLFADKRKIYLYTPTCLLAMYLACLVDFFAHHYPLWDYPAPSKMSAFFRHLEQQTGIYPVFTYLFIQTLPRRQTILTVARHIFYWSLLALAIEWIAIKVDYIRYQQWWTLGWSYLADWTLLFVFYIFHKWREKGG